LSSGADGNLGSVATAFLVSEHDPPHVGGDGSFQAADRFVSGFAFSDLLVEVSPPGSVGHPDLCDCYEMHTFAALTLSSEIGEDVDVILTKAMREQDIRIDTFTRLMIDGESFAGRLRIPYTACDIKPEIDLRARICMVPLQVQT
jgi:hypothetical protein